MGFVSVCWTTFPFCHSHPHIFDQVLCTPIVYMWVCPDVTEIILNGSLILTIIIIVIIKESFKGEKFNYVNQNRYIYYPPEVRRGKYWGWGVFLLQYLPLVSI